MSVSRRELLRHTGGVCLSLCLPRLGGCAVESEETNTRDLSIQAAPNLVFAHGVASGDPLPDAVILWTRVTPEDRGSVSVQYVVASDSALHEIVASGDLQTDASRDYTIKVDVTGLEPDVSYYYAFNVGDVQSEVGRTRTAPLQTESARFAVVSCASYGHGYFHAYRAVAEREELNAVIHLGDYIYEYATGAFGTVRRCEPAHEILTLDDYRRRYAHYRQDSDLRALHRVHPMIVVWDDHEIANNAWHDGAQNHNPERGEGDYGARKAAATRAFFEWQPVRESEAGSCFRQFAFGNLVDLIMLDTRLSGRDAQIEDANDPRFSSEGREILGREQTAWLAQALDRSSARWRLIGQQVMVGPMPVYFNPDCWSSYPAARRRFLELLAKHPEKDCVVLSGDVHSSWAMNLAVDPYDAALFDAESGDGAVAVELVVPGITSPFLDREMGEALEGRVLQEPHVKYAQLWRRGYMLLEVDAERVRAQYCHFDDVQSAERPAEHEAEPLEVHHGEHRLSKSAPRAQRRSEDS